MNKKEQPVIRRRKNGEIIEKTRIENGEVRPIIEKASAVDSLENENTKNKAIEGKLKSEIQGFLAKRYTR